MKEIQGQCLCGDVEFKFFAGQLLAYQCHCLICRKTTCSAFSTTLMARENGFTWISGAEKVTSYSKENGYKTEFCSCCGSPVPNRFRGYPLFSVPVGSLNGLSDIEVIVQLHLGSRATWDNDYSKGEKFANMPTINEMLEFLHVQVKQ